MLSLPWFEDSILVNTWWLLSYFSNVFLSMQWKKPKKIPQISNQEQLTVTNFMLNGYDYVVRKARVFREVDGQEVVWRWFYRGNSSYVTSANDNKKKENFNGKATFVSLPASCLLIHPSLACWSYIRSFRAMQFFYIFERFFCTILNAFPFKRSMVSMVCMNPPVKAIYLNSSHGPKYRLFVVNYL